MIAQSVDKAPVYECAASSAAATHPHPAATCCMPSPSSSRRRASLACSGAALAGTIASSPCRSGLPAAIAQELVFVVTMASFIRWYRLALHGLVQGHVRAVRAVPPVMCAAGRRAVARGAAHPHCGAGLAAPRPAHALTPAVHRHALLLPVQCHQDRDGAQRQPVRLCRRAAQLTMPDWRLRPRPSTARGSARCTPSTNSCVAGAGAGAAMMHAGRPGTLGPGPRLVPLPPLLRRAAQAGCAVALCCRAAQAGCAVALCCGAAQAGCAVALCCGATRMHGMGR